jgi:hypothetical protein
MIISLISVLLIEKRKRRKRRKRGLKNLRGIEKVEIGLEAKVGGANTQKGRTRRFAPTTENISLKIS